MTVDRGLTKTAVDQGHCSQSRPEWVRWLLERCLQNKSKRTPKVSSVLDEYFVVGGEFGAELMSTEKTKHSKKQSKYKLWGNYKFSKKGKAITIPSSTP